jgi:hypothetical protein
MGRWPLSEGDPTTLPKECTLSSIPFGFRKNKGGQSQRNFYKKKHHRLAAFIKQGSFYFYHLINKP